jgi:hypothetical protein
VQIWDHRVWISDNHKHAPLKCETKMDGSVKRGLTMLKYLIGLHSFFQALRNRLLHKSVQIKNMNLATRI